MRGRERGKGGVDYMLGAVEGGAMLICVCFGDIRDNVRMSKVLLKRSQMECAGCDKRIAV